MSTIDVLLRVREFCTIHNIKANAFGHELYEKLTNLLNEVTSLKLSQVKSRILINHSAIRKEKLRETLRRDLALVSRTARTLGLAGGPNACFVLPENKSDQALIECARSFYTEAQPRLNCFVKQGLKAEFLDTLASDLLEFEKIVGQQRFGKTARLTTTAGMFYSMDRGRELINHLDVLIRNMFAEEPHVLDTWMKTKRAERPVKTVKPEAQPVASV